MRILILGGDGMLGHQLLESWQDRHDVHVTLRRQASEYSAYGLFTEENSYFEMEGGNISSFHSAFEKFRPQLVVNAIGIVKQRPVASEAIPSLEINSLLPHRLSELCRQFGAKLVHLSTDCVFSGSKGDYSEKDAPDAGDLYGRSKLMGELHEAPDLTLRTSIIGLELARKSSLIEWFLAQTGRIKGFTNAIYSGFTTLEIARIIEKMAVERPDLSGLWHVSSNPISKFELLQIFSTCLGQSDVEVVPFENFHCDRSLNGTFFRETTGYQPPSWQEMLSELAGQVRARKV